MQLTTLDVFIMTALCQQPSVTLSRAVFDTHSQFVKQSSDFEQLLPSPDKITIRYKDLRLFKLSVWFYWQKYEQDELLPFEENGFSALRLAKHAKLFAGMLYNSKTIQWDLKANRCYIQGEQQAGSSLRWAWDWFAVNQIASREYHIKQDVFNPQLIVSGSTHTVGFFFNASHYTQARDFSNSVYCALASRIDREIMLGNLRLVDKSSVIVFSEFPKKPIQLSRYAQRLVWLCAKKRNEEFPIPIIEAYEYVTGRKRPKQNNTGGSDTKASPIELKQKTLENARNAYWKNLRGIVSNSNIKITEAPYIAVEKEGISIEMRPL